MAGETEIFMDGCEMEKIALWAELASVDYALFRTPRHGVDVTEMAGKERFGGNSPTFHYVVTTQAYNILHNTTLQLQPW